MSDTRARINELLRVAPPFGADAQTRAAWFEQRATEFDALADEDPFYACQAAEFAQAARDKANRIRAGGVA